MIKLLHIAAKVRSDYVEYALGAVNPKRVLDLAAGHCNFSLQAARFGCDVVAIDARDARVPENLPKKVTFIKANVLNEHLDDHKPDLVLCLGLFYHLTVNEQHQLLNELASLDKPVLIDSHYAANLDSYDLVEDEWEGLHVGKFYHEALSSSELQAKLKASATSIISFWHCEAGLLNMLFDHFGQVTKLLPESSKDRSFYMVT